LLYLTSREVFEKTGYFDEKYFLYYEDADLSVRTKNKGFKIVYIPKSIIWHKTPARSADRIELQDYYITRNRLLFGFRYASFRSKSALLRESLLLLFKGRKWQKRGVIDYCFDKFGKEATSMSKISGVVIVRNAEEMIADCLDSLSFCDEIVVIDSFRKIGPRYRRKNGSKSL